jgi:hypothetical protein
MTPSSMVQDMQQSFGQYGLVPATTTSCGVFNAYVSSVGTIS